MAFHNWEWEFDTSSGNWNQLAANNPGVAGRPWARAFGFWGQSYDPANQRLFFYSGQGNSSGSQGQLDSGFPFWTSDADLLQDLWVLNLTNRQWTALIPVTNHQPPVSGGELVYYPPSDSLFQVGSQLSPASSAALTNLVMRFGLSDGSTNFSNVLVAGTPPPLTPSSGLPRPFYNAAATNIICFLANGVYALTPAATPAAIVVSNANYGFMMLCRNHLISGASVTG